jgi:hypothetical protein
MSLIDLVHKHVVIKFAESTNTQFKPATAYAFNLAGVDGMGFLLIQDLKPGTDSGHEIDSTPYWINKDIVREIRELTSKPGEPIHFTRHEPVKPKPAAVAAEAARQLTTKNAKAKSPKAKTLLN